jgi:diguanylate cyclase (GGDEF)-like protein
MADYVKQPDDPNRGRYSFSGKELSELLGLQPFDVSDAVDMLSKRGYAKGIYHLGTYPYSFGGVCLTPEGRLEAEKYSGKPQAHEVDAPLQIRNRGAFDADSRLVLEQHKSAQIPVALLMVDIDDFKPFNDEHGHPAGDLVLKETASAMRNVIGSKGTCYRYGGDEFVVILPNYTHAEVIPLAERIRSSVASIRLPGLPQIAVSVGVGVSELHGYDPGVLLAAADDAMYAVKHSSKG